MSARLSPSSRHSSLSRQMQWFTVAAPSASSRGRSRPRQTPESSRSTSLRLHPSTEGRFLEATRRRISRRPVDSAPAPLGCAEDEVDVVSTQCRSRPKTKRGHIRFRRGSSRPIRWLPSQTGRSAARYGTRSLACRLQRTRYRPQRSTLSRTPPRGTLLSPLSCSARSPPYHCSCGPAFN